MVAQVLILAGTGPVSLAPTGNQCNFQCRRLFLWLFAEGVQYPYDVWVFCDFIIPMLLAFVAIASPQIAIFATIVQQSQQNKKWDACSSKVYEKQQAGFRAALLNDLSMIAAKIALKPEER